MNPGTWQQYVQRPDNRGLSIALVERKYIQELYHYQMYLSEVVDNTTTTSAAASAGGGGSVPASTPSVVITDSDVLAFIAASGITDNTQKSAVNTLVTSLKGYSLWSNLNAIYPFVGGTASTHKWNLKDPRDLNAAYRLSFSGGWTHSSNGITGNASNTYADTFFSNFTTPVRALGVYTRNTTATTNGVYIGQMETLNTTDPEGTQAFSEVMIQDNGAQMSSDISQGPNTGFVNNTNKSGFYTISSGSLTSQTSTYKNGTLNSTTSVTPVANSLVDRAITIGALRSVSSTDGIFDPGSDSIVQYTNQNIAFAFIGTTFLSAAQMSNLYTAVQAYQTTLGRQV